MKRGLLLAAAGVLGFSLSLPATRMAAPELGAVNVGLGRALIAGVLAAALLFAKRDPFPGREHLRSLLVIGATVVLGFPLMTAYAMQTVSSSHGSVLHAMVPLVTAVIASLRTRERPTLAFWIASVAGMLVAMGSALFRAHGAFGEGDIVLLASIVVVALGYVEGGKLSMALPGWRVISWALVLTLPVSAACVLPGALAHGLPRASPEAYGALAYVSVVSMFIGFFAWYQGLAEAGIARASQLQLVQPILGLLWSALLLGERVHPTMWLAAVGVLVCVRVATLARTRHVEIASEDSR